MGFNALTLECFLAVVETGSFTHAADRILRTQSAVSQQIHKLENQVGRALFVRGKKLSLTADGELLLSYARRIVRLNREAMDHFLEPELTGEVRFGLPEDFASVYLADVLTEYTAVHPRIFLHIECDLTLNLFERFKRQDFDLVLVKMSRPEDFSNGTDVWSEALEWVGRPDWQPQDGPIELVVAPAPCVYRARAIAALEKAGLSWRIVFSSHSYASTLAAVRAGMGLTVLPKTMVPDNLALLPSRQLGAQLDDTHISLLKHQGDHQAINSFERFVMQHLKP